MARAINKCGECGETFKRKSDKIVHQQLLAHFDTEASY